VPQVLLPDHSLLFAVVPHRQLSSWGSKVLIHAADAQVMRLQGFLGLQVFSVARAPRSVHGVLVG
jgi:hypothetical protein